MKWLWAAAMIASPTIAHAAWHKASSKHFIIYSKDKPDKLRAYAERLERFDKAVRLIHRWDDPPVGDGNRVTIYVVDTVDDVQRLSGADNDSIYGFYLARYTGSIAFSPRKADEDEWGLQADSVFFHEYGHHLMFQHFEVPFPNWYVEGFAELIGTPAFGKDGSVSIGIAPKHRAYGLLSNEGLTTRQLLTDQPKKMTAMERESLYGRGWLLTHYLSLDSARKGQLQNYFKALAAGQTMAVAATSTFGDLTVLNKEVERYVRRPKLLSLVVSADALKIEPIAIRPLAAGEELALPWQMQSKRGVDEKLALQVAQKLRGIAEQYPDDPFVQGALAEAEFDVKRYDAAVAAAEAALKADPGNIQALVYKGKALMELAEAGKPALIGNARKLFLAANKLDPEDPEPLFLFYETFVRAGTRPTPNAIAALHYASVLAPSDEGVRLTSAVAYLNEQKGKEARAQLLPIAFDPHGGEMAEQAREVIALIDSQKTDAALQALLARRTGAPSSASR